MYYETEGYGSCRYGTVRQAAERVLVPIVDRVGALVDIRYKDDTDRLARIRWMECLVENLTPPASQAKIHTYIQWVRTSDVNSPNWNYYDQYRRGEKRWLATHSYYEIATKLSPMEIFNMCGHPIDHTAVFVLLSHSVEFKLDRFT